MCACARGVPPAPSRPDNDSDDRRTSVLARTHALTHAHAHTVRSARALSPPAFLAAATTTGSDARAHNATGNSSAAISAYCSDGLNRMVFDSLRITIELSELSIYRFNAIDFFTTIPIVNSSLVLITICFQSIIFVWITTICFRSNISIRMNR